MQISSLGASVSEISEGAWVHPCLIQWVFLLLAIIVLSDIFENELTLALGFLSAAVKALKMQVYMLLFFLINMITEYMFINRCIIYLKVYFIAPRPEQIKSRWFTTAGCISAWVYLVSKCAFICQNGCISVKGVSFEKKCQFHLFVLTIWQVFRFIFF